MTSPRLQAQAIVSWTLADRTRVFDTHHDWNHHLVGYCTDKPWTTLDALVLSEERHRTYPTPAIDVLLKTSR